MENDDKADILEQVRKRVFPPGSRFSKTSSANTRTLRYWVLPGKQSVPRWLIPERAVLGLPVLINWEPYDKASRLKWKILMCAYRMGLIGFIPGIKQLSLTMPEEGEENWERLGWSSEWAPPVPVIYVGTPSPTAKLVVILVDSKRRIAEQVVKIPIGEAAKKVILHEAGTLKRIQATLPGFGPDLVFREDGEGLNGQRYLNARGTGTAFEEVHLQWLLKLRQRGELTLSGCAAELKEHLARFENVLQAHYEVIQDWLGRLQDETPLSPVWVHGDFVCWNVKKKDDGTLVLVDWEDAHEKGLPFLDVCHFYFMMPYQSRPVDEAIFPRMLENPWVRKYMSEFNITEKLARLLFCYYLLNLLCKKLEQGNFEEFTLVFCRARQVLENAR